MTPVMTRLAHLRSSGSHQRLAAQLSAILATLLTVAILAHSYQIASRQTGITEQAARERVLALARSLAVPATEYLLVNDLAALEDLARRTAAFPGVLTLEILDSERRVRVRADVDPRIGIRTSLPGNTIDVPLPPSATQALSIAGGDRMQLWLQVGASRAAGWIHIDYDLEPVRAVQSSILRDALVSTGIALVLSLVLLWLFLRRPLTSLHQATAFAMQLDQYSGQTLDTRPRSRELMQLELALNHASRQLAEQATAVSSSTARLQAVMNYAADAIVTIDDHGIIESCNPAVERLFGYSAVELIGRNVSVLMPEPDRSAHDGHLARYLASGEARVMGREREVTGRHHDGSLLAISLITTEMRVGERRLYLGTMRDIRARKQAESALRDSEQRYAELVQQSPDAIITLDLLGHLQSINPAAEQMAGYSGVDLIGRHFGAIGVVAASSLPTAASEFALTVAGIERSPVELRLRHRDGHDVIVEALPRLLKRGGKATGVYVTLRDIAGRKQAEQAMVRLGRILDYSSNEVMVVDAATLRYTQVSRGALVNLGYTLAEMTALTPLDIMPDWSADSFEDMIAPLRSGERESVTIETEQQRRDGSRYPVELRLQLSASEEPPVFLAIAQDTSERKHAEDKLRYLANYDTLTGLPNRTLLQDRISQTLIEANRHQRLAAVMFIDLDRFKLVNDSLGHEAGDKLLQIVAERLNESVRGGDTVARLGGDEFVVVLANVAHVDDISRVAEKILAALAQPVALDGREVFTTPSIGITVYPFDDEATPGLLKNADAAMYLAKEKGRNNYQFFTADLNSRAARRFSMESALRRALERDELLLHYQPLVELRSGRITGAEALIRWQHPEWGLVSPAEFIPLAEETGLILPIGEWVLNLACAQARDWHDRYHCKISVNLSGRQLDHDNLVGTVRQVLADTGLYPGALTVEVTESLLMRDMERSASRLRGLAELGLQIAMDDFGTGYSSLSYLKLLPIDILKIDRAFVRDLTSNADDAAIATAIIAMAHSLDIQVVAEGVETMGQMEFLRGQGCDCLQGYLFSKPVTADEFGVLLAAGTIMDPIRPAQPSTRRTVLVVDDEKNVVTALTRVLGTEGYQVLAAASAGEAFELLACNNDIGLVISDHRMPGVTGLEFLTQVRDRYPRAVRMILTGYAEMVSLSDAINKGAVHKFLTKPWEDAELRAEVRDAFRMIEHGGPGAPVNIGSTRLA